MQRQRLWIGLVTCGLVLLAAAALLTACQPAALARPTLIPTLPRLPSVSPTRLPAPTATVDRLAEPRLPSNPTQLETGRHLYWLNCMACHGDQGQGLTDEFRSLYVEDANCWARGCHGGRLEDQGFPVPHNVPAIISASGDLPPFPTPQTLFEFLRSTHPPQNPGFMPDSDYWALTAYLWDQNQRLLTGQVLGPGK